MSRSYNIHTTNGKWYRFEPGTWNLRRESQLSEQYTNKPRKAAFPLLFKKKKEIIWLYIQVTDSLHAPLSTSIHIFLQASGLSSGYFYFSDHIMGTPRRDSRLRSEAMVGNDI